jgi:hypothetical protein
MPTNADIGAEVKYLRRYNLGSYQHEEIEIKLTGPLEVLKNNPNAVTDLGSVLITMGSVTNGVFVSQRTNDPIQLAALRKPEEHKV